MQDSWADAEFDSSVFHDRRLVASLVEAAEAIVINRSKSFSASVGDRLRQSVADTLANEKVTPSTILEGHARATVERSRGFDEILVAHDTCVLSYSNRKIDGLGPINDTQGGKGLFSHSALAMSSSGVPLGVVSADFRVREHNAPKRTDNEERHTPISEKESYKWIRSHKECARLFMSRMEDGASVTLIGDRENDVMEAFAEPRHPNMHLLIRSTHARKVELDGSNSHLPEAIAAASVRGSYALNVPARPGRSRRDASMQVKFLPVALLPPDYKRRVAKQAVWAVHTCETTPPANEPPIEWTLLTTREVLTLEQAIRTIESYTRRWTIERLHYTLKTGCLNSEKLQFRELHTLFNALAFYYVLAWNVLSLTALSRDQPDASAEDYIEPDHLTVLRKAVRKPIDTLRQAARAIAELAGYANYPKSPPPGIKMIWTGVTKLNDMVAGARLFWSEA
jgi:hypothetical protein